MTDMVAELNAALAAAQGEFPPIQRDKTVTVQTRDRGSYTFSYAPLDAILAACRPVLARHGLALVQLLEGDGDHGGAIRTELRHASGAVVGSTFPLPSVPATPQQLGSMLTYLRRYTIVALLGIAAEEDDDAGQAADTPVKAPRKRAAAKKDETLTSPGKTLQISALLNQLQDLDGPPGDAASWKAYAEDYTQKTFGVGVLGRLTDEQADRLIQAMEDRRQELERRQSGEDAPAGGDAPPGPSPEAVKRMFALFNEKGLVDRDARLAYSERVLDRKIASSKELAAGEVFRIMDALAGEPDVDAGL
jgi:ERF superfamily